MISSPCFEAFKPYGGLHPLTTLIAHISIVARNMPLLKKLRALAHAKPERKPAPTHVSHLAAVCPRIHPLPCVDISSQDDIRIQNQSHMLTFLPLEIRQLIYQDVVSIGVLHVLLFSGRLAFVACCEMSQRGEPTISHECWRLTIHEELLNRHGHRGGAIEHRGPLSLLRTCRQIFVEAIEIFYSQNTFDFRHPEILNLLNKTIPLRWFNSLYTLHLSRHFKYTFYDDVPEEGCLARPRQYPGDLKTWENACHALACMQGLKDLCIVMEGSWIHHDPKMRIIEPLREVKIHGSFDVYMPIPREVDCEADWDATFNVIDNQVDQCKFCE